MTIFNRITLLALLTTVPILHINSENTPEETTINSETTFDEFNTSETDLAASFDENTINSTEATTETISQPLYNQPFFLQPLTVSDDVRNIAYAMLDTAFTRWTTMQDVIVCQYNTYTNKASSTKYKNNDGTLTSVKSETYTGPVDGSPARTKCVRKGKGTRSDIKLNEGVARMFRATTKPEDMDQVSLLKLYETCTPTSFQADSASEVTEFLQYMALQLQSAAIDPSVRIAEEKPLLLLIVSKDPFLHTIADEQWLMLRNMYNVTTLYDAPIRKHVLKVRTALCSMVKDARDSGVDVNPSFLEGLFGDVSDSNYDFDFKKIVREIIKNVVSVKGVVGMAAGFALYTWFIHRHVVNGTSYAWDWLVSGKGMSVKQYRINKEANAQNEKDAHQVAITTAANALKTASKAS